MSPQQTSNVLGEVAVHLRAINSLLGNVLAGPARSIALGSNRLRTKYHDGAGNLAEIERNANGTLFVRLVRPGVSKGRIVRSEHANNVVYGIRDEGREPDVAYACFEGSEEAVTKYLREQGFSVNDKEGS